MENKSVERGVRCSGSFVLCRQDSCDNDDDFTVGWKDELPPGVKGCLRPKRPANSFLRVKSYAKLMFTAGILMKFYAEACYSHYKKCLRYCAQVLE